MNETYFEILVNKKTSPMLKIAQIATAALTVVCALAMLLGFVWGIVLAAVFALACYFVTLFSVVEYEYLYVDKELQIDRILSRSKRKHMLTLDLKQLEILAPVRSHELDRYRNGKQEILDYSSGEDDYNKVKYMVIVGDKKVIFEPTEDLVKTIQMFAPRKVFTY